MGMVVAFLVVVLMIAGAMVASALINGFVLSKLWVWFIVPTFGLGPLSMTSAIGLGLVVSFLTHQYIRTNDYVGDDEEAKKRHSKGLLVHLFVYPFVVLLIGWIVTWFR